MKLMMTVDGNQSSCAPADRIATPSVAAAPPPAA
jgi:hypothetical protein